MATATQEPIVAEQDATHPTSVEDLEALATERQKQNIVWTLTNDSILITSVAYVRDKVVKHNQGKFANLARYSMEGFVEYLFECGINAVDNSVDSDIKRRNEAAYVDAMSKLTAPAETAEPDAMVKYFQTIAALKRKFGIGGDQKQV
jgi:hypothetical protein